jgi:hypothetical protein
VLAVPRLPIEQAPLERAGFPLDIGQLEAADEPADRRTVLHDRIDEIQLSGLPVGGFGAGRVGKFTALHTHAVVALVAEPDESVAGRDGSFDDSSNTGLIGVCALRRQRIGDPVQLSACLALETGGETGVVLADARSDDAPGEPPVLTIEYRQHEADDDERERRCEDEVSR